MTDPATGPGPVPASAIQAAAEACPFINRDALARALEAAWPVLAAHARAAERERIRQALDHLADQD
jgi:hypothetical protein